MSGSKGSQTQSGRLEVQLDGTFVFVALFLCLCVFVFVFVLYSYLYLYHSRSIIAGGSGSKGSQSDRLEVQLYDTARLNGLITSICNSSTAKN